LDDQAAIHQEQEPPLELARRNPRQTTNKPLRMFVTGPAGAGKWATILFCTVFVKQLFHDAKSSH
jgi:pantothenate kinase-related protein Tda10